MDPTKGLSIPRESDFEGQWDLIMELSRDWGQQTLGGDYKTTKPCAFKILLKEVTITTITPTIV